MDRLMFAVPGVDIRLVDRLVESVADADMLQGLAAHTTGKLARMFVHIQGMHNPALAGHTVTATAAAHTDAAQTAGKPALVVVHIQSMHNPALAEQTVAAAAAEQAEAGSDKGLQEAVDHPPHHLP
jgi:hypothetical protein